MRRLECAESQIRSKIRTAQAPETGQDEPNQGAGCVSRERRDFYCYFHFYFLVYGRDARPLCSSFVLCLVLIWPFETPREIARLAGRPLCERSVQVSKTYIAVFNITHVLSIKGPRRYAIESIGLAVGTIRSIDWHVAGQLARRMHKAANPDIFPPCPDQSSPPEYPA